MKTEKPDKCIELDISAQEKSQTQTISRRRLLKAITATGGAAVASTVLPSQWQTPVIEVGALPAHAQLSPRALPEGYPPPRCLSISNKIDIVITQDISGSIYRSLDGAKEALKQLVNGLNLKIDQVGLVAFNSEATLKQTLTRDADEIKLAIDNLSSSGGTDIAAGIQVGQQELMSARRDPKNSTVMILLSDGVSPDPIPAAEQAKANGILMVSIGIGFGIDLAIMKAIATNAEDDFYFTQATEELIAMFDKSSSLCNA